jgi:adenylyltransferase/sulfurtransferase
VAAAKSSLAELNPEVEIVTLPERLGPEALERLVSQCDVVLDCSDNFATRHAVNRACVRHARPLVSGAAIRFDGQVAVFDLRQPAAPCYACLFPESGEGEELRCAVMGVFAPLTGVIGAMQAMEAIKLVAQAGETLNGRLLMLDAKRADWRAVRIHKDTACAVCSGK